MPTTGEDQDKTSTGQGEEKTRKRTSKPDGAKQTPAKKRRNDKLTPAEIEEKAKKALAKCWAENPRYWLRTGTAAYAKLCGSYLIPTHVRRLPCSTRIVRPSSLPLEHALCGLMA